MGLDEIFQRFERRKEMRERAKERELKKGWYPFSVKYEKLPLSQVPKHLRTEELCFEAVQQDWRNLKDVPPEAISRRICLAAIEKDARALALLPPMLRLPEFCELSVGKNGMMLEHVPLDRRTHYICALAVGEDKDALPFAPESVWAPMGKERFLATGDVVWQQWRDEREGLVISIGSMGDAGKLSDPGETSPMAKGKPLFAEAAGEKPLGSVQGQSQGMA